MNKYKYIGEEPFLDQFDNICFIPNKSYDFYINNYNPNNNVAGWFKDEMKRNHFVTRDMFNKDFVKLEN